MINLNLKLTLLNKHENSLSFIVDGVSPAFVNALRRTAGFKIPTLAVEEVIFTKNSSGLFDETLAHRIGLIPWKFNPGEIIPREECNCEGGCHKCTVTMSLKKKGACEVKAKDLKVPKNSKIKPVNPETVIVRLNENQKVELEAIAQLGIGETHAKWQGAIVSYNYYPQISISGKVKNAEVISERCPGNVFEIKNGSLVVADEKKCISCFICEELSENISVKELSNKFILNVESVSGHSPEYLILEAIDMLGNHLDNFKDQIK